jgi:hypothetical protein
MEGREAGVRGEDGHPELCKLLHCPMAGRETGVRVRGEDGQGMSGREAEVRGEDGQGVEGREAGVGNCQRSVDCHKALYTAKVAKDMTSSMIPNKSAPVGD